MNAKLAYFGCLELRNTFSGIKFESNQGSFEDTYGIIVI